MAKLTIFIHKILGVLLTILMAIMVLNVTWQVLTRFIMKNPSPYTEELAGFLLIWIGILGASYAYSTKAHLGIDVLTYRLTGLRKKIIEVAINLIVIAFALFVMIVGGWRLVKITFTLKQISPALGIEMGYIYMVIPISGGLLVWFALNSILQSLHIEKINPTSPLQNFK